MLEVMKDSVKVVVFDVVAAVGSKGRGLTSVTFPMVTMTEDPADAITYLQAAEVQGPGGQGQGLRMIGQGSGKGSWDHLNQGGGDHVQSVTHNSP